MAALEILAATSALLGGSGPAVRYREESLGPTNNLSRAEVTVSVRRLSVYRIRVSATAIMRVTKRTRVQLIAQGCGYVPQSVNLTGGRGLFKYAYVRPGTRRLRLSGVVGMQLGDARGNLKRSPVDAACLGLNDLRPTLIPSDGKFDPTGLPGPLPLPKLLPSGDPNFVTARQPVAVFPADPERAEARCEARQKAPVNRCGSYAGRRVLKPPS